ncbi:DUF4333 domain-containing protein [Mycolicibacterium elephantis]|uniref:DUF4333 domain-containing protein n=1 Tax=Mycolicibacterium elephantis TaxID=81858 RepID=UPI003A89347E
MANYPQQGPRQPWWWRPGGAPLRGRRPEYTPPRRPVAAPPPLPPPRKFSAPTPPVPSTPAPDKRSRRRTLVWAGSIIVVFEAALLVAALWFFGFFDERVLDVRQAEIGVRQILSNPINGYGANDVTSVSCNEGKDPTVKRGTGFTCQVVVNGARRSVQVVFRDDVGTYEVDGPR